MMFLSRKILFLPALLAAAVVPYLLLDDHWSTVAKEKFAAVFGGEKKVSLAKIQAGSAPFPEQHPVVLNSADGGRDIQPSLAGAAVVDLAEILRFDVTPGWVTSRWSRVTTTLADLELDGLRVPLVTGTKTDDLAGSLTYYFDKDKVVNRISFQGYTGDPARLVALATERFHLAPEPALGAGLYLAKWNGKPTSALMITYAPVVRAETPHTRLQVMMEINRHHKLSDSFSQLLKQAREARRW